MENNNPAGHKPVYPIRHKPIHVGIKIARTDEKEIINGVEWEEYSAYGGPGMVFFKLRSIDILQSDYILFQYVGEEWDQHSKCDVWPNVYFVGLVYNYKFIEGNNVNEEYLCRSYATLWNAKALLRNTVDDSFYYFASSNLVVENEGLIGKFNAKERALLNALFAPKYKYLSYEEYSAKKKAIRKQLSELRISDYASSYDVEEHIDKLLFDWVKKRFDEDLKFRARYINPKMHYWGTLG